MDVPKPYKFIGFGAMYSTRPSVFYPAVLEVKTTQSNKFTSGFGPESIPNPRFPQGDDSLDPPPDPPGRGETR
jgi:hypothetical protein